MTDTPVLVLGGTGRTGRRVTALLRRRGLAVRPASPYQRGPFRLARRVDLAGRSRRRPRHLPGRLRGGRPGVEPRRVLRPGGRLRGTPTGAAVRPGLGGSGGPEFLAGEKVVRDSGVGRTVLRPTWFAQSFSETWLLHQDRRGPGAASMIRRDHGGRGIERSNSAPTGRTSCSSPDRASSVVGVWADGHRIRPDRRPVVHGVGCSYRRRSDGRREADETNPQLSLRRCRNRSLTDSASS